MYRLKINVTCEACNIRKVSKCHLHIFTFFFKHRWRRETRIKTVAGRPQGEVAYYAPCGKKLRQYPDVMKVPRPCSAAVYYTCMIQKQML